MPRGPARFKQSDLTRALRATKAAGVEVSRIKITKDGIEIDAGKPVKPTTDSTDLDQRNEWDTVK